MKVVDAHCKGEGYVLGVAWWTQTQTQKNVDFGEAGFIAAKCEGWREEAGGSGLRAGRQAGRQAGE